ncbi:WhiB family transcriptional regulator [Rhodococcus sp. WS4]|nr:WhiB family transcriptional regulator [Rhodococcus sp. WS4]
MSAPHHLADPPDPAAWQRHAACRGTDTSMFFSPDMERGLSRARRESRAKQICHACPVLAACRDYALTAAEPYGIWGGLSENDRRWHARRHRTSACRPSGGDTEHRSVARGSDGGSDAPRDFRK